MLDQLADMHDFPVPEGMVDMEFNQIWQDFENSLKEDGKTIETADKPEEELRKEYRDIAVRRVRLGLLLSNIGDSNQITVTAEELNRAIMMEAQRFPGQERRVFEFYQKNPDAMQQIRAPIFEDKVIDFILDKAEVTEKEVDRETLFSDPDEDAAPEAE
jgi:trigger factor